MPDFIARIMWEVFIIAIEMFTTTTTILLLIFSEYIATDVAAIAVAESEEKINISIPLQMVYGIFFIISCLSNPSYYSKWSKI